MQDQEFSNPPLTSPQPPSKKKPRLTGWRLALVVVGIIAVLLRVLLAVISFSLHHHQKTADGPAPLPGWPLKAGDVFTLKPGDPVIAKWAESPDNDGFIVQLAEQNGKPLADAKVCALEPDYMADAAQPGGTLTLLSQDGTGDWRVHWVGGDTVPPAEAVPAGVDSPPRADSNCGKDAVFSMSQAQLHAWHDMQAGIVVPLSKNAPDASTPGTSSPHPPQPSHQIRPPPIQPLPISAFSPWV